MREHRSGNRFLELFGNPTGPKGFVLLAAVLLVACLNSRAGAQATTPQAGGISTEEKVERLTAAVAKVEAEMQANRQQLDKLLKELAALRVQLAADKPVGANPAQPSESVAAGAVQAELDEVRERQAIAESEIATHEQSKVETESKYPLKLSGLLLFNSFVNTRQVDVSAAPAYAIPGPGSTGLSLRQTVLGLDARGPHLFGATSRGDLRVDFFANGAQSNYAASGILRLRTAHVELNWKHTQAFAELDRSILEPNEPGSLVAVAQPELAWAGNLWNWNPQIGVAHEFALSDTAAFKVEAALIDTFDPQPPSSASTAGVTQSEASRWPGTEARVAFERSSPAGLMELGGGGYFSPHRTAAGEAFDAWAATADLRFPVTRHFEFTANAYRGQALDGLGADGYVNYYYLGAEGYPSAHALEDAGGWTQLKARAGERVEFNTGFGTDNPFAKEVEAAASYLAGYPSGKAYSGLARNRSFYANVIWSPSAYLQFSLEYKRLWSNFVGAPMVFSDSIGLGAGYRF
jgi:uncharacterized coiled-coil protein SlyX